MSLQCSILKMTEKTPIKLLVKIVFNGIFAFIFYMNTGKQLKTHLSVSGMFKCVYILHVIMWNLFKKLHKYEDTLFSNEFTCS